MLKFERTSNDRKKEKKGESDFVALRKSLFKALHCLWVHCFCNQMVLLHYCSIILMENNSLVSDQAEVCNILNDFYINIAKEIGINNQTSDTATTTHPSIQAIKDNSPIEGFENFDFKPVSESQVLKIINSLSSKKATGVDQIPPKILKLGQKFYLVPFPVFLIKEFPKINFLTGLK